MNHFMVDIETLGVAPTSAIVSIGVVQFDMNDGLGQSFHRIIDIQSCLDAGLTVDASTIRWWMAREDKARAVFDHDGVTIAVALLDLNAFVGQSAVIWCNGANFDAPILDSAYKACGIKPAWAYYNVRDYRTVKNLVAPDVFKQLRVLPAVAHDAVSDAEAQALTLRNLHHWLQGGQRVQLVA